MNKTAFNLEDRECILYNCDNARYLLLQPVDEHDIEVLDKQVDYIVNEVGESFALVAFRIKAWNDELSPWEAAPVFGKESFGGGAGKLFSFVEQSLIKDALTRCELSGDIPVIIGGYSLAALFALWCGYETDSFTGVAAASPSVWFPDWIDYAKEHDIKAESVYLSLGDKEEKTKNKVMARVGDCIREQQAILNECDTAKVTLEWNEGNHFRDSDIRTGKAFSWCIQSIA